MEAAIEQYIGLGLAILPLHGIRDGKCTCNKPQCGSPGKHPLTKTGLKEATLDVDTALSWLKQWPWMNIGIATGAASLGPDGGGIFVIDIDGEQGEQSIAELEQRYCLLPETWEQLTGRGRHLIFKRPAKAPSKAGVAQGIDLRGDGGYIVAEPSTHASGKSYMWKALRSPEETPLLELPEAWLELIPQKGRRRALERRQTEQLLETFIEGERNKQLFNMGSSMRGKGFIDSEIEVTLLEANRVRSKPPLADTEVKCIAQSCGRYPVGKLPGRVDYPHTDIGASEIFVDIYIDSIRYVAQQDDYYIWDNKRWAKDDTKQVRELAKAIARVYMPEMAKAIEDDDSRAAWLKWATQMQARKRRDDMISTAQSSPKIAARINEFDVQQRYFNLENGVLDLQTMTLLPHDRGLMLSHISPAEYKAGVVCERWVQFILEIMDGDKDAARFLQKTVGYALAGDPKEDCMFIFYGEKTRNGKSTFVTTIRNIFGDYGKSANPESLALSQYKNGGGPSSDIARLKGARFVSMSEPDKGLRLDAALVKKLTGRDTLTARYLHREFFEFQPQFAIFMNTNHLPYISDMTLFTSGRIFCIPFPVSFKGHEDRSLADQFVEPEAMSGILNWCLDGYKLYKDEGLKTHIPTVIQAATGEYERDSDTLGQFLEDCIAPCTNNWLASKDLYDLYSRWSSNNGYFSLSQKSLTQEMKKRGYQHKRTKNGWGFVNIILGGDNPFYDDIPPQNIHRPQA